MAITPEVTKMWSRDAFTVSATKGANQRQAKIIESYQITCPPDYTKIQVSNLPGVPASGTPYPGRTELLLTERNYQRISPIYWIATTSYEGNLPSLAQRPELTWRNASSTEPIDEDYNGQPICTKNLEPIDGVTKEIHDAVLDVERKYLTINIPSIHAYLDAVNSDAFAGFAAGVAKLTNYSAKAVWGASSIDHWIVSASIVFRVPYNTVPAKAWYARRLHEGYYEKNASGRIIRAVDDLYEPVTKPVLLKENGQRETNGANAFFQEFQRYGSLSYSSLGLLD